MNIYGMLPKIYNAEPFLKCGVSLRLGEPKGCKMYFEVDIMIARYAVFMLQFISGSNFCIDVLGFGIVFEFAK